MSLQVEKLEKNMAKLTIEVSAEKFEKAIHGAYLKNRNKINVQGFRKGKATQAIIEKIYGAGIFYEDAANALIPEEYENAAKESNLDIVSHPRFDAVQLEKGKPFIFTAEVALKPEVQLGAYKGIEIEKQNTEVTDDEVMEEIDKVRGQNARTITVEDRPVAQGDMTVIDFEGFVDGVAFEGGKAEDHDLTIGSGAFIPGFEEQLVGTEIGKETEIFVTFPQEYHAESLAGKPATFKVTVKEIRIKELPELDDEFAQDVSDFDTLDEYRADIKEKLEERKQKEAQSRKEDEVIDKIIEGASMEIPDAMIETQTRQQAEEFARRLQQQGLSVEQYFQYTGLTADRLFEQMRPGALKRIQSRLVLEAIAAAEHITASDEEVDSEIAQMAQAYEVELEEMMKSMSEKEREFMKMDLAVQKVIDFVVEAAVEA